jgi:hypothetical protein
MMEIPPKPTGSDSEARFARWTHERLLASRTQDATGSATNRTTRGSVAIPPQPRRGGIVIGLYRLKSMATDWIICRTWDGTNEGTTDVKIAKPPKLRFSIVTLTMIDGTVITYIDYDTDDQTRTAADDSGNTENQVIGEPYLLNDLIYAAPARTLVQDDDGKIIVLLDLNVDGRAWEEIP